MTLAVSLILLIAGLTVALLFVVLGRQMGGRSSASAADAVPPSPVPEIEDPDRLSPATAATIVPQLTHALDDLRLGVVVYDERGRERYRNRVGQQFAVARHGEALVEAALERVASAARIGLSPEEEVKLYGPPARILLVQGSPLRDGKSISGVVATIEDVTAARHLDQVRSDFVANVSHELRTPVGALSVLAETLAHTDDPEVRQRLSQRVLCEAERLSDTIEDLLVLSRLESDRDEPGETFDLVSVVTSALERTAESSSQRSVNVVVDRRFDGPILIDGRFGHMVSAVANLIENGTKYSSTGSRVTVTLDIDNGTDRPVGVLLVSDDGIGIPEKDQARIFERFYRVDSARRRETGGTGLGLSIVRNAVSNHHGSVTVESVEGRGSTFTVQLPLSPTQLQAERLDVDDLLVD